jgi:hypothetical protein
MTTPARVGTFVTGLVVVFAITLGIGRAVGPVVDPPPDSTGMAGHADQAGVGDAHLPGGLMVSQDGYTLVLEETRASAGRGVPLTFTIAGPDGEPVTAYDVEHEKRLHLIVVRRD